VELGGALALILILGKLLAPLGLTITTPADSTTGLGAVFLFGFVASSSSCLSLVGGLLLSLSIAWREVADRETPARRLLPLLLFNGGRLAGFFLLGGAIGALGAVLQPSLRSTGALTAVISAIMVLLGLHLLRLLPRFPFRSPFSGRVTNRLMRMARSGSAPIALLLGALTFFLPCGFTQSMQLFALSSGNFLKGGTIMLVFALGTLPSLLGISLLSSLAEGAFLRWFFKFSGMLVVVLGLLNLRGGLLLLGVDVVSFLPAPLAQDRDPSVSIDEQGRQVIAVTVTSLGYSPSSFTIRAGKETWVYAYAPEDVAGCAAFLTAPAYNLATPIQKGGNWLGPISDPRKDFSLTCSMGMYRAEVHVIQQ
jgi:sulfite exporter TauE/SafE